MKLLIIKDTRKATKIRKAKTRMHLHQSHLKNRYSQNSNDSKKYGNLTGTQTKTSSLALKN